MTIHDNETHALKQWANFSILSQYVCATCLVVGYQDIKHIYISIVKYRDGDSFVRHVLAFTKLPGTNSFSLLV